MIYVITKNRNQFDSFCREIGINPHNPNFIALDRADKLRGMVEIPYILYGEYYKHYDWKAIEELLLIRNGKRVTIFNMPTP